MAGSISRRTTRSSSSAHSGRWSRLLLELAAHPRGGDPDHLGAEVAGAALGEGALLGDMCPWASIVSTSSVIPSPFAASVRTTGTFQARYGPEREHRP